MTRQSLLAVLTPPRSPVPLERENDPPIKIALLFLKPPFKGVPKSEILAGVKTRKVNFHKELIINTMQNVVISSGECEWANRGVEGTSQ